MLNTIYVLKRRMDAIGIRIPELIIPTMRINLEKWATIACDQFTQDADYWERAAAFVGDAPSTLNMILPEICLRQDDVAERIERVHETMRGYIAGMYTRNGRLNPPRKAGAFVERTTESGVRRGLLLAVDLEHYGWDIGFSGLIRASEGVVRERLPPRMDIRRDAALDLPHIMLLIDDRENTLMPLLSKALADVPVAYDTQLMAGGGRVRARLLRRKADWTLVVETLENLARTSVDRYNTDKPFLFAVGDGNHSLAAAKAVWEEEKRKEGGREQSWMFRDKVDADAARYALAEVVNLFDPAIAFEPIHRLLFNVTADDVLSALSVLPGFRTEEADGTERLASLVADAGSETGSGTERRCGIVSSGRCVLVRYSGAKIPTVDIDPPLERFEKDYIHGERELFRLSAAGGTAGILLPPFDKSGLFETVARSGPLPRKSFSMGQATEKRYYLESRLLFK